jgi:hypothetical protein
MDMHIYLCNRRQFPPEELEKYAGQYVAWSPDGRSILASDDDPLRLDAAIQAAGYDPAEVVVSAVPFPDEIILGAGGVAE